MRNVKLYALPAYTMKCRMYLNNNQKKKFDDILYGIKVAYNVTLYDMLNNGICVKEGKPNEEGKISHFPDFSQTWKSERLKILRDEHEIIKSVPASALSGNNGVFQNDMKKSFEKQYENKTGIKSNGKCMPIESIEKPNYYNKKSPRKSYTYQIKCNYVIQTENNNVFKLKLQNVGTVKIRGWNKNIKFDKYGVVNFLDYCEQNPSKYITITLSKDNCGDYYVCFKFGVNKKGNGIQVYKPFIEATNKKVGIDVGKKSLMTLSDGTKYKNKKFMANERKHLKKLSKRLSRRYGWANVKFRDEHKISNDIVPSNKYNRTVLKIAKLHRKIARKREHYNHNVTADVIKQYGFIGVETLSIQDMFKDTRSDEEKDIKSSKFIPKRNVCREHENTADAAMGSVLEMLNYKCIWYYRICQKVGKWFPSSKQCNKCGYIKKDLQLSDRYWICPRCGIKHDRDENAAIGILNEAIRLCPNK